MNVLFLSSWYPNRVIPYNGNFIERHAEAAARKHSVKALHALSDPNLKDPFEIEFRNENGIDTYIVYYKKVRSIIPGWSAFLKLKRYFQAHLIGLKQITKDWNIDIVHLNILYPAGLMALYLKYKYQLNYVVSENWTGFLPIKKTYERKNGLYKAINRIIANNASFLLPVSKDLEDAYRSHGFTSPSIIIPNVVDTDLFQQKSSNHKYKKTIIHVSNFKEDHKNMKGIFNVIKALNEQRNDFQVHIVGDGDVELMEQHREDRDIPKELVKITGRTPIEGVAKFVGEADLFFLFSNWENLPCVVLEAFSAGLPVVSSDVGGTREHLQKERGELTDAKDETAAIKALNHILDNYDSYELNEIRQYAVDRFSYEEVGNAFDRVYQKVTNA